MNEDRNFIVLIKEEKYYNPIYKVIKDPKVDKKIRVEKYYEENEQIKELKNYYNESCNSNLLSKISGNNLLFCKKIINILKENKIKIVKQIIDNRNKCKYILLESGLLLPVYPSGISYEYKFDTNVNKVLSLKETIKELNKINKILNLDYIPKIVYYNKKDKNNIKIISLFLENEFIIPIKSETILEKSIKSLGIPTQFESMDEIIDNEIKKYNENPMNILDNRYLNVKNHLYKNESYNIYRLELSLYLNNNKKIKEEIINIVRDNELNINNKKNKLREILFGLLDNKLFNKKNQVNTKMGVIDNKLPNLDNYNINNLRDYCKVHNTKDKCNNSTYCIWTNNNCLFRISENLAIDLVNKVLEEMVQDNIQFKELIQENNYYVSDIVDYSQYSYRTNQKIITTNNFNLKKITVKLRRNASEK